MIPLIARSGPARLLATAATLATAASLAATATAQSPFPGSPGVDVGQNLPAAFEGSGAVFHPRLNRLFVVSDDGRLTAMEKSGALASTVFIGGDLEGLTIADPDSNFLYLALENPDSILEFDLATSTVVRSFNVSSILTGSANQGLEALAFVPDPADPEGGIFHAGQQSDGRVYRFRLPIASSATATSFTYLGNYAPLSGVTDISSLDYDRKHGRLYALFDAADRLVELTKTGAFVQQWQMPGVDQEGIAIDGCEVFAAEDTSNHLWKYFDFRSAADCDPLSAQAAQVSISTGATVEFVLRATAPIPPLAGCILLGSATGTAPGISPPGLSIPLNYDAYFQLTAASAGSPPFVGTLGAFDALGKSSAALVVPPLPPVFAGLSLHHAFIAFHPVTKKLLAASNAEPLAFIP